MILQHLWLPFIASVISAHYDCEQSSLLDDTYFLYPQTQICIYNLEIAFCKDFVASVQRVDRLPIQICEVGINRSQPNGLSRCIKDLNGVQVYTLLELRHFGIQHVVLEDLYEALAHDHILRSHVQLGSKQLHRIRMFLLQYTVSSKYLVLYKGLLDLIR